MYTRFVCKWAFLGITVVLGHLFSYGRKHQQAQLLDSRESSRYCWIYVDTIARGREGRACPPKAARLSSWLLHTHTGSFDRGGWRERSATTKQTSKRTCREIDDNVCFTSAIAAGSVWLLVILFGYGASAGFWLCFYCCCWPEMKSDGSVVGICIFQWFMAPTIHIVKFWMND